MDFASCSVVGYILMIKILGVSISIHCMISGKIFEEGPKSTFEILEIILVEVPMAKYDTVNEELGYG